MDSLLTGLDAFSNEHGMTNHGWGAQLAAYAARGWRATFFPVGIAHAIVVGSAWAPTPWRAVQRAACDAPHQRSVGEAAPSDWTTVDDSPR